MGGSTTYTVGSDSWLKAFDFIALEIRRQDLVNGEKFLERLYTEIQEQWDFIQNKILSVKNLWSVVNCPDEFLQYLKNIVGWTDELSSVTDELDSDSLRRLISVSVAMWKKKTVEDIYTDALNLLIPSRAKIWNWFYFRTLTDSLIMDEEHQGRDPWMFSFPGVGEPREFYSNLRIVKPDDEKIVLMKSILRLLRPMGERIEITYLKFLDLFGIENDVSQWLLSSSDGLDVSGGVASIDNTGGTRKDVYVSIDGSKDWNNYVVYARIKGEQTDSNGGLGVLFYNSVDTSQYYYCKINVSTNKLELRKIVGLTDALIMAYNFSSTYILQENIWYGLRVQISPEGLSNRIKVYLDGVEKISVLDGAYSKGRVGIFCGPYSKIEVDEVEVLGLPAQTDLIDINS